MKSELRRRIVVRSCRSDTLFGQRHPGKRFFALPPASGRRCRPPPGELAGGRRSKPSPRFFRGWRYAVSTASRRSMPVGDRRSAVARAPRGSGVRGSRACAPPCPPGYAPRKEPSRRSGSTPPRPCGPLCRPPPGELARGRRSKPSPRFFAVGGTRFRPPLGGRCRSETGAPFARAPRGSGVRGSRACAPPCPPGYAPRKEPSRPVRVHAAAALRAAVPAPTGRTAQRSAFQAVPALFSRLAVRGFDRLSAVDAGRRPALRCRARSTRFGGTRGFKPSPRFFSLGGTPSAALRAAVPV